MRPLARCSSPPPPPPLYPPSPDAFGKDVNIDWKHGVMQLPPRLQTEQGRISIIAWGWVDMETWQQA